MNIRIVSNYTEIFSGDITQKAAKEMAKAESLKFDDTIIVEVGGEQKFMASYGYVYKLSRVSSL